MGESRASIIRAVQTPLGIFTLLVLVVEVVLAGLAFRVEGLNLTILLVGMILLLFGVIWMVYRMGDPASSHSSNTTSSERRHDVFLSSILAGFNDESRLLAERKIALEIAVTIERELDFNVYYAGRSIESMDDFDPSQIGPSKDLDALKSSRYFLMIYPERTLSSVIFEAGYALNRCDTSIYFVRDVNDLPYLMRRLPDVDPRVHIIKYVTVGDITRLIKQHREGLFTAHKGPASAS